LNQLRVFNTMTNRKEEFRPLRPRIVTMFVCGPTVQGPMHLGHARTYIFYDVVARLLKELGCEVDFLMNVTDIDERITSAAREEGTTPELLASRYSTAFKEDLNSLGVRSVTKFEHVSRRVNEAIGQVKALLRKGYAYESDGWVYFDTKMFPRFGRLSRQTREELALRPLELSTKKRNLTDFSLWRPEELIEGKWQSPWGLGSPGWHIQDTAVTFSSFGPQYDIHGGAYELIYPHHEAEIAQGESISGVSPMVKYWVHTHLLTMEGEKMSKSKGNVVSVRDALQKYSADELRFYFLLTHYRQDMDLSGISEARKRLQRLRKRIGDLGGIGGARRNPEADGLLQDFWNAMKDDFDTPRAIQGLEQLAFEPKLSKNPRRKLAVLEAFGKAISILGVGLNETN
jgi:cysteinyl-tRNA synthetase